MFERLWSKLSQRSVADDPTFPSRPAERANPNADFNAEETFDEIMARIKREQEAHNIKQYPILKEFFNELWDENRQRPMSMPTKTRLSHAGEVHEASRLGPQPIFLSRIDDDIDFYLDRTEGRSVSHFDTTQALKLVNFGPMNWDKNKTVQRFNNSLKGIKTLQDFEHHKNRAMLEWTDERRSEGHDIDGWYRGDPRCEEEVLLVHPQKHLRFVSNETKQGWRSRVVRHRRQTEAGREGPAD